jgi:hypothetical protein
VSHDEARHSYVKTAPKPFWPGIVIAGIEVALLVGLLAVALSGAFVLVAGAFALLTLLGVVRVGRQSDGGVVFSVNLLVFTSETYLTQVTWKPAPGGEDDSATSGVREPRHPLGPGPAAAGAHADDPTP